MVEAERACGGEDTAAAAGGEESGEWEHCGVKKPLGDEREETREAGF